jgi:hypothetical protein
MNLAEYFNQEHTPAPGSPVGVLMALILKKNPGMDFEAARAAANAKLGTTPGNKMACSPSRAWTDEEEAAFAKIMAASGLARVATIQLFRRCGSDMDTALVVAGEYKVRAMRAEKAQETKASRQLTVFEAA